ncbi:MmgE/PrpD family protein [Campylobacter sputorum]|uniref:MmgE/PrpD family protein n=1 Tax=Campylobacter sputorum TaxID=206 RepID=UPI00053C0385|nr:MmgE/PrpD family protein [Campylobacter sputorum]
MYAEILAQFISSLKYDDIPKDVIKKAKELMLDTIGVSIAGRKEQSVIDAIKTIKNLPNSKGEAKIWSSDLKFSPNFAAMINGISAHALDFDDTHTQAIFHGSSILTPICLTYGEGLNISHKQILTAFVAGWEVGARIGIASKGSFHKRGFHTTAICGIFGATTAMCVMLKLNKSECINALGFAASYASGINEFLSNGSNSKVLHIANCINNAILISNFAKFGMFGPVSIFEGRDNIFKTFGYENECDKDEVTKDLGKIWQTMQVSTKPYPCCHFAHGFIECAILLKKDGIKADDIKHIKCFVDEVPINFICEPLNDKYIPKTEYEAKFSMPFLMALGFFDENINLESYKNLSRGELIKFSKKITYEKYISKGFPKYFPGHLEAVLQSGNIVKKDVFINKGNFDNPLSFEEILFKFKNCSHNVITSEEIDIIVNNIKNYEYLS